MTIERTDQINDALRRIDDAKIHGNTNLLALLRAAVKYLLWEASTMEVPE